MNNSKFISLAIFLICANFVIGQKDYINILDLPTIDCSGESSMWEEFHASEHKVLVLPNNPSDSIRFQYMSSFIKRGFPDSSIKFESELTDDDLHKSLFFYGQIQNFSNWNDYDLPIIKNKNGFTFIGIEYNQLNDGIFYQSENLIIYAGNSLDPIWKQQTTNAGYYKFMIFSKGLLDQVCTTNNEIIDISNIRERNYSIKETEYLYFYIDRKIGDINTNDSFIIDICTKLDLPLPNFKITTFIHHDPNATRLFSNFFDMAGCDTLSANQNFATVAFDCLHITGNNLGFIRHESFHYLWKEIVGFNESAFLSEGIQKYYEFLCDSSVLSYAKKIQLKHLDFDIMELVDNKNSSSFWNAPTENNYPISYELSGLFVKFLVDNWGLDKFKKYYSQSNSSKANEIMLGISNSELVARYYSWVNNI